MSDYATIVTENVIIVINSSNGEEVQIHSNDERFELAKKLIKQGKHSEVFSMDTRSQIIDYVQNYNFDGSIGRIEIKNGRGFIMLRNLGWRQIELNNALVNKILQMYNQGVDATPLYKFVENLYNNPSKTSIDELYLFIEASNLPITDDGHFIAYKIVRNNYMDIYSGTMSNKIGDKPEMLRQEVDDNRNRTCSTGLHFCSKSYLSLYGSSSRNTDRCMLVKINPADVVSIPSDYNNAKGRAWRYEVVGELKEGWRNDTSKDYTEDAVVDSKGEEINTDVPQCPACESENVIKRGFNKARTKQRHQCKDCGTYFYTDLEVKTSGRSLEEILDYLGNNDVYLYSDGWEIWNDEDETWITVNDRYILDHYDVTADEIQLIKDNT